MSAGDPSFDVARLDAVLAGMRPTPSAAALELLVEHQCDRLPMPGSGATLVRWRALACVAAHDLSLAKLYEGHTDALAILRELGAPQPPTGSTWGVWAAEAPSGRAFLKRRDDGRVLLQGGKSWCSGAATCSHALLTAWHSDGRGPQLVSIDLEQPGISVDHSAWHAIGMAQSASLDVRFRDVEAELVGEPGAYLTRPGFWHGGAGIAACWYGGATAIAGALLQVQRRAPPAKRDALRAAALGKVDLSLHGTAALLRDAAHWIDTHPLHDASAVALRVRQSAEASARLVLDEVGKCLGAAPYCRDSDFARMAADLPVFIRQSHADRDFAALGDKVADGTHQTSFEEKQWTL